jgi:hypothetical protein
MACVRAMIIGQTVSVTRGPAWKLTDEFTHIASNTWSPLSPLLRIFFPFVSSCRRRSGSRELSIRMAPPFTLKSSCHAPHVGLYLLEKSSLSLSLRVSIRISSTEGERERATILPAGNNSTTYLATHDRCIQLGRTRGGIQPYTHTTPWWRWHWMVCCFANDCSRVMDKRLAASTTFSGLNWEQRKAGWKNVEHTNLILMRAGK